MCGCAVTINFAFNHYSCQYYLLITLITLQGLPAATTFAGISLVTTLLAPITVLAPIVTPFSTTLFTPSQTLSPIITSADAPLRGSSACQSESVIREFAPHLTLLPSFIILNAPITVPLKPQLLPIITLAPLY